MGVYRVVYVISSQLGADVRIGEQNQPTVAFDGGAAGFHELQVNLFSISSISISRYL